MEFYLSVVDPVAGERMVIDYEEDGLVLDDLYEAIEVLKADPRGLQVTGRRARFRNVAAERASTGRC